MLSLNTTTAVTAVLPSHPEQNIYFVLLFKNIKTRSKNCLRYIEYHRRVGPCRRFDYSGFDLLDVADFQLILSDMEFEMFFKLRS